MNTLIIGGTGTVGSQVVSRLIQRNENVSVLTSDSSKIDLLPQGAVGVVGNLEDKASIANALKGVERVFFVTPFSTEETRLGLNVVSVAKEAGVKKIVYMSVHRLEDIPDAPHFTSKIPVENAIKESGIAYTILRPNNFYQNDLWFKQPIMDYGIYPQPIGMKGLHRVDVRDIADAAVNALLSSTFDGKTMNIVGPDLLMANSTAALFSKYLGKEVVYGGDDLVKWAEQAKQMLPEWLVDDFAIMYRHFQNQGLIATPEHLAETEKILGHKPRTFEAFAAETAHAWKHTVPAGALK